MLTRLAIVKNINNGMDIEKVIFDNIGDFVVQISLRTAGFITKRPLSTIEVQ